MRLALAAALLLVSVGSAPAQAPTAAQPSQIMALYRAYAAAEARGDYAAARTSAAAALAAAEGEQSPRVGVLATNLARLLAFKLNDLEAARSPAARALEAGGDGVDAEQARLLVTLTTQPGRELPWRLAEAREPLHSMLASAACADLLYCYEIARAWGYWAFAVRRHDVSMEAYAHAVRYAERLGAGAEVELALALTGVGAAALYEHEHKQSAVALNRAVSITLPLVRGAADSNSIAERVMWTAQAWRSNLESVSPQRLPPPTRVPVGRGLCPMKFVREPMIEYPPQALERGYVGTIVVRHGISEAGNVQSPRIIASAPNADYFGEAVLAAVSRWRVVWEDASGGKPCDKATDDYVLFIPFAFQ